MQERTVNERIVKSKCLAGALVWLGFEYEKTEEGFFAFKRDYYFDIAWKDLHAQRNFLKELRGHHK
mgnify:CR=1 FL=1